MRLLARSTFTALLLGTATLVAPGAANAQFPVGGRAIPGYRTPALSPYINLLRGGDPSLNYFGLVRPQINFQNSLLGVQQQVNTLTGDLAGEGEIGVLGPTGHPAAFMNYSHYYGLGALSASGTSRLSRGGAGAAGGAGPGMAPPTRGRQPLAAGRGGATAGATTGGRRY
jgi:hypothetical protein